MGKITSDSGRPSKDDRELTAAELGAVTGGTIVQVNGGGNTPSAHPGGANVVLCDGSVRYLKDSRLLGR